MVQELKFSLLQQRDRMLRTVDKWVAAYSSRVQLSITDFAAQLVSHIEFQQTSALDSNLIDRLSEQFLKELKQESRNLNAMLGSTLSQLEKLTDAELDIFVISDL